MVVENNGFQGRHCLLVVVENYCFLKMPSFFQRFQVLDFLLFKLVAIFKYSLCLFVGCKLFEHDFETDVHVHIYSQNISEYTILLYQSNQSMLVNLNGFCFCWLSFFLFPLTFN